MKWISDFVARKCQSSSMPWKVPWIWATPFTGSQGEKWVASQHSDRASHFQVMQVMSPGIHRAVAHPWYQSDSLIGQSFPGQNQWWSQRIYKYGHQMLWQDCRALIPYSPPICTSFDQFRSYHGFRTRSDGQHPGTKAHGVQQLSI